MRRYSICFASIMVFKVFATTIPPSPCSTTLSPRGLPVEMNPPPFGSSTSSASLRSAVSVSGISSMRMPARLIRPPAKSALWSSSSFLTSDFCTSIAGPGLIRGVASCVSSSSDSLVR